MTAEDIKEIEDDASIAGTADLQVVAMTQAIAEARSEGRSPIEMWELRVLRAARRFDRKIDSTARRDLDTLLADIRSLPEHERAVLECNIWNHLGMLTIRTRRTDVAVEAFARALGHITERESSESDQAQFAASNLAVALYGEGRFGDAIRCAYPLMTMRQRLYGDDNEHTQNIVGLIEAAQQKCDPEELAALRADIAAGRLGLNLASLRARQYLWAPVTSEDFASAHARLEEALEADVNPLRALDALIATSANDGAAVALARRKVARWFAAHGRHDEAVEQVHLAMLATVEALGPDHPVSIDATEGLAIYLHQAGRYADAVDAQRHVVARLTAQRHPDEERCLQARAGLVTALHAHAAVHPGAAVEAMNEAIATLADVERVLGASHPTAALVRSALRGE
jgi:tetratricopeptide (TPR) repeat protein